MEWTILIVKQGTILAEIHCPGYGAVPFHGKSSARRARREVALKEIRVHRGSLLAKEIGKMIIGRNLPGRR